MSIIYGTPAELAAYIDPDAESPTPPAKATALLRKASQLVLRFTRGATYSTDADGMPLDAKVLAALTEATLEQASAWAAHGIDPSKGAAGAPRQVSSKALNGAQASYVSDPTRDMALSKLWGGEELTQAAWDILRNAGLISSSISTVRHGFTNTPTIVGQQGIHGGYPSSNYPTEPIPGVNI